MKCFWRQLLAMHHSLNHRRTISSKAPEVQNTHNTLCSEAFAVLNHQPLYERRIQELRSCISSPRAERTSRTPLRSTACANTHSKRLRQMLHRCVLVDVPPRVHFEDPLLRAGRSSAAQVSLCWGRTPPSEGARHSATDLSAGWKECRAGSVQTFAWMCGPTDEQIVSDGNVLFVGIGVHITSGLKILDSTSYEKPGRAQKNF